MQHQLKGMGTGCMAWCQIFKALYSTLHQRQYWTSVCTLQLNKTRPGSSCLVSVLQTTYRTELSHPK